MPQFLAIVSQLHVHTSVLHFEAGTETANSVSILSAASLHALPTGGTRERLKTWTRRKRRTPVCVTSAKALHLGSYSLFQFPNRLFFSPHCIVFLCEPHCARVEILQQLWLASLPSPDAWGPSPASHLPVLITPPSLPSPGTLPVLRQCFFLFWSGFCLFHLPILI